MKQSWRTHAVLLVALLALNAAVKFTLWIQTPQTFPDSLGYIAPAMRLLDGLGYGNQENGFRTPTYPLLIAAVVFPSSHTDLSSCREARVPACLGEAQQELGAQANLRAVVAVQILLGMLTILLVYAFAWQIARNAWIAALCAVTYPIDLSTGYWEISLLTDALTTFLLALAVWLTWAAAHAKERRLLLYIALGVVLGALALCHSVFTVYAIVPAAFLGLSALRAGRHSGRSEESRFRRSRLLFQERDSSLRAQTPGTPPTEVATSVVGMTGATRGDVRPLFGSWLGIALVVVIPALGVLGWSARNYVADGVFTPSTIAGYNLTQMVGSFMEQAPPAYGDLARIYVDYRSQRIAVRGSHSGTIFFAYKDMLDERHTTWAGLSQMLAAMSLQMIREHPLGYLGTAWESFQQFWKFGLGRQNYQLPLSFDWVKWFLDTRVHVAWMVLFFITPFALLFLQRTHRIETGTAIWIWFAIATVLYAAVLSSAFNFGDNERYRTHVARFQYSAVILVAYYAIISLRSRQRAVNSEQ